MKTFKVMMKAIVTLTFDWWSFLPRHLHNNNSSSNNITIHSRQTRSSCSSRGRRRSTCRPLHHQVKRHQKPSSISVSDLRSILTCVSLCKITEWPLVQGDPTGLLMLFIHPVQLITLFHHRASKHHHHLHVPIKYQPTQRSNMLPSNIYFTSPINQPCKAQKLRSKTERGFFRCECKLLTVP